MFKSRSIDIWLFYTELRQIIKFENVLGFIKHNVLRIYAVSSANAVPSSRLLFETGSLDFNVTLFVQAAI